MMNFEAAREALATYRKYGWLLRRLLGPAGSAEKIKELAPDVPFSEFEIEAAWFSREPKIGGVAWEIRSLSESPFALLENLDEDDSEFPNKRRDVETRLIDALKRRS
jgi:hypothetical protein